MITFNSMWKAVTQHSLNQENSFLKKRVELRTLKTGRKQGATYG